MLPRGNETLVVANLCAVRQSGQLTLSVETDDPPAGQDRDAALAALTQLLHWQVETLRLELEASLPSIPLGEPQLADSLSVCHEPHLLGQRGPHVGQVVLVTNNQDFSQGIPAVDYFLLNLPSLQTLSLTWP